MSDDRQGVGDATSDAITGLGIPSNFDSTTQLGDASSSAEDGEAETDAGDAGLGIWGGWYESCPSEVDAAICPALLSGGINPGPNYPAGFQVGCFAVDCPSLTSCTTCMCVDGDGGGTWECTSDFQPDRDADESPCCEGGAWINGPPGPQCCNFNTIITCQANFILSDSEPCIGRSTHTR